MSFTEVAFELADADHPLCRLTRDPSRAHAIYRILDTGETGSRARGLVSFHGPPEGAAELLQEMRLARPASTFDVLSQTANDAQILTEGPVEPSVGLSALPTILARHDLPAIVEPIVAVDGRLRVRLVILRQVQTQQILRALQDAPRTCGFSEFRITRVGALLPSIHVESARRTLPPEHEALLALAASMGYYETPKVVTLDEISRRVGLSISPVHKRLKAAEETIVAQHVGPTNRDVQRRRQRVALARADAATLELQVRVRGDVGPSGFLAAIPGARASIHPQSADGARLTTSIMVVLAPDEAQTKLLASLEDRPEVASVQLIERSHEHMVCRLQTRDRGAYALGWWSEAWGSDASLRSIVVDNGEATLRAIVHRALTPERLQQRLEECAHAGGWSEWDLLSARSLARDAPPANWPEPLTQRQLEVLRVAHALAYYRTPRGCTLEDVAGTLGVSANAIHKNLVLAESKLIAAYLAAGV